MKHVHHNSQDVANATSLAVPVASVVIAAYNSQDLIGETLASIAAQTFSDWECIVVDDGSTDNTRAVIEKFADRDKRFRYVFQKNGERCRARNHGLSFARGEFVAFVDHDDLWKPEFLQETVADLRAHPEADLVFAGGYQWNGRENIKEVRLPEPDNPDVLEQIIRYGSVFTPVNALMRRARALAAGGFDPGWTLVEDFEFWIRFGRQFTLRVLPLPLAIYRVHAGNAVQQNTQWLVKQRALMDYVLADRGLPRPYHAAARACCRRIAWDHARALLKQTMVPASSGGAGAPLSPAAAPTPLEMARAIAHALRYSPPAVWHERWVLRALVRRLFTPARIAP